VVVLRAPGGADPLVVAGGPDGARLRSVVGSWKAEPLEFVAEGAVEPLLRAAMVPLRPVRVEPWPALRVIDVVLSEAQADALVALGCHDLSDLVLAERAAVTAALGGAEAARAVSEAAAWAVELGEPGVRRRGW
jgi:hypothetical protein